MTIPSQPTPAERWAARRNQRRARRDPRLRAAYWFFGSVLLFAVTVIYLVEPSRSLPHFLPGYNASSDLHQIAHAVIAGFLSIVAFFGAMIQLVAAGIPGGEQSPASHIRSVPPSGE